MSVVERRRSPRITVFNEEAALMHAGARDIPVKLIDLSLTGLSFSFLDLSSLSDSNSQPAEPFELSIAYNRSELRLRARMIRQTPLSVAVEFVDLEEQTARKLVEKLQNLEITTEEEARLRKARAATG
jgi:hypothetical protein